MGESAATEIFAALTMIQTEMRLDPLRQTWTVFSRSRIEQVINAWKVRMLDLARDKRMRAFFVIKNVGWPAGARVAHSVSELIAMAVVPPALKQKLEVARDFYERKKRAIFGDMLRDEV